MSTPNFQDFLRALPKCEHHMHLEGSLTPTLLFSLAAKNSITLPQDDPAFASPSALLDRYTHFTSLDDFLHYYYIGMSVLLTSSDYEELAWDYFQHAKEDGVAHAEVFFDPQAHLERGVEYGTVIEGFERARRRAEEELGISTGLISCFLRHLPPKDCVAVFESKEVQRNYKNGVVEGIGLDSSEKDFPPVLFKELYAKAKAQGLQLTAHAGEEAPASYIASALNDLGVTRIDHGIALASSPELLKTVAEAKVMLTVCPLSNVVLRSVDTLKDVPIRTFLDAGVRFSINSDDPAYFGGYILENYVKVQEVFGLSVKEWESIVKAGIEGSWCSDERKAELLRRLESVIGEWEGKL